MSDVFDNIPFDLFMPEDTMPLCVCDLNATGSKDGFLTQAPMSSTMGGFRPRTVITLDPAAWRSKALISDSPFLFRRSASACGELPSLKSNPPRPGARSARYATHRDAPFIMPRGSNMSVARFCDWTEEQGDCFSVSRLYREIASIPQSQTTGSTNNSNKGKINCNLSLSPGPGSSSSGVLANVPNRTGFNSPGRMFVRDKKALTRGEREIIEGIYKNRSDLNAKDAIANLNFHVKSHQEAWLTGKLCLKNEKLEMKPLIKSNGQHQQQQQQQHPQQQHGCDNNNTGNNEDHKPTTTTRSISTNSSKIGASMPLSGRLGDKFSSSRKLVDTSPFPKCSQCQLEHRGTFVNQDLAKRAYYAHQQNQENNWDSRPCAPPSTPDKSGATESDSGNFNFEYRSSTEKNNVSNHTSPAQVTVVDSSSLSTSTSSGRSSGRESNSYSPRREANGNSTPRNTSKIQKTINIIQSVLEENSKSSSSGFHSCEALQDLENSSESGRKSSHSSSDGSESDARKVKVKVYLPTADNDEHDDAMSESGVDTSSVHNGKTMDRKLRGQN